MSSLIAAGAYEELERAVLHRYVAAEDTSEYPKRGRRTQRGKTKEDGPQERRGW